MFCFRLSFFPRGGGPGGLRAELRTGQPGRATGPGGWLQAGRASSRATGSGGWLRAGRIVSGRAGQPSLQLAVRTGEPTCGSTGTPTGGSIVPSTEAKSGPSTGGSIVPTADAKFGPSTALQPKQSSVLQPLLQPTLPTVMPMHLNRSRRQCNEIPEEQHRQSSKIYVKLHIFIRKAKLSTT